MQSRKQAVPHPLAARRAAGLNAPTTAPLAASATARRAAGLNAPTTAPLAASATARLTALLVALLAAVLVVTTLGAVAPADAARRNPATPGDFTGYGFDQCLAPEQWEMDRWLNHSPFLAAGIYISGESRGCREQPNLTPPWVRTQLRRGWRLLPITLGPQASCSPHFPRYGSDETINPSPGSDGTYRPARSQGWREGRSSVAAAGRLGIVRGSVLWYDLEGFDDTMRHCRESAIYFLSAWTWMVRHLGYQAGVYSSAGSGIEMLDRARVARRAINYPNYLWIARWDGVPNTSTTYISDEGWNPNRRVKQYQGGHRETWGGVTINIDRNWLDVGRGLVRPPDPGLCNGIRLNFYDYLTLRPGAATASRVRALQCLLKVKGVYDGRIHGVYGTRTIKAAQAWQRRVGATVSSSFGPRNWVTLLSDGWTPVVKRGSTSLAVRRLQRALNAGGDPDIWATGIFGPETDQALRRWQRAVGLRASGVANAATWAALQR